MHAHTACWCNSVFQYHPLPGCWWQLQSSTARLRPVTAAAWSGLGQHLLSQAADDWNLQHQCTNKGCRNRIRTMYHETAHSKHKINYNKYNATMRQATKCPNYRVSLYVLYRLCSTRSKQHSTGSEEMMESIWSCSRWATQTQTNALSCGETHPHEWGLKGNH